jgi:hypothetical protein
MDQFDEAPPFYCNCRGTQGRLQVGFYSQTTSEGIVFELGIPLLRQEVICE